MIWIDERMDEGRSLGGALKVAGVVCDRLVRPYADRDATVEKPAQRQDSAAQPEIADRVVGDGASRSGEQRNVRLSIHMPWKIGMRASRIPVSWRRRTSERPYFTSPRTRYNFFSSTWTT